MQTTRTRNNGLRNETLILLGQNPGMTPQEELLARLNLELDGHAALDIPVTPANRKWWLRVAEAQGQDPVYR